MLMIFCTYRKIADKFRDADGTPEGIKYKADLLTEKLKYNDIYFTGDAWQDWKTSIEATLEFAKTLCADRERKVVGNYVEHAMDGKYFDTVAATADGCLKVCECM